MFMVERDFQDYTKTYARQRELTESLYPATYRSGYFFVSPC